MLINRLRRRLFPAKPMPVFDSFSAALAFCGNAGCETEELVNVVVAKTMAYNQTLLAQRCLGLDALRPMLGIAAAGTSGRLRVLDFGGGAGAHYANAMLALRGVCDDVAWHVVETPAMAQSAARGAFGGLRFFADVHEAAAVLGDIDLVLASSSLQYPPAPLDTLQTLLGLGSKHVFVTRTPMTECGATLISVQ